jgi:hypothetical protein
LARGGVRVRVRVGRWVWYSLEKEEVMVSILAMNSEKNMPVLVMNAAGYVQKIPAVEVLE